MKSITKVIKDKTVTDKATKPVASMLLPELKALATSLGVAGATAMRKADLVAAIASAQGGAKASAQSSEASKQVKESRAQESQEQESQPSEGASGEGERSERGERDDDDRRGRRNRRDRNNRDRNNRDRGPRRERDSEVEVSEDDVLSPVAGIVDILDNYAFVRTTGYLPSPNDVYVSLGLVKRFGLRKGDAVTGLVRQPREGDRQAKFNPLVRVDSINGADPEEMRGRVEFGKLTPLYPQDRLRLETDSKNLSTRVIDLVAPLARASVDLLFRHPRQARRWCCRTLQTPLARTILKCT